MAHKAESIVAVIIGEDEDHISGGRRDCWRLRTNWDWGISRTQNGNSTCRFGQEVGEKKNAGGDDKIGHISGAPSTATPLASRMRLMQWEWLCLLFDEM
tara:strand:- start:164 stop:460 length:297 start_codon:yes stop_codon:yes gene_type:complete